MRNARLKNTFLCQGTRQIKAVVRIVALDVVFVHSVPEIGRKLFIVLIMSDCCPGNSIMVIADYEFIDFCRDNVMMRCVCVSAKNRKLLWLQGCRGHDVVFLFVFVEACEGLRRGFFCFFKAGRKEKERRFVLLPVTAVLPASKTSDFRTTRHRGKTL